MKRRIWFIGLLSIALSYFIFAYLQQFVLDPYSSTLLAFSYQQNGFGSRILMGSIFSFLCSIFPFMDNAMGASWFSFGCSLIFDVALIMFACYIDGKIKDEKAKKGWSSFIYILILILIPSLTSINNIGKPDALILTLVIGQVYLLMESKNEWLVPVFSILAALLHEGFLFMVACVSIGITFHKALDDDKYWKLFWANVVVILISTAYLMTAKLPLVLSVLDSTRDRAVHLSLNGIYAENILNQRYGLYDLMANVYYSNKLKPFKEFGVFLILFAPIAVGIIRLIKDYFKKDPVNMTGFIILVPLITFEYIMFCDYGRYVVWTLFAIVMFIGFLSTKDEEPLTKSFQKYIPILTAIALLCTPLQSCYMSLFTSLVLR